MCTGMSFGKGGPACPEGQEDGHVWWGGVGGECESEMCLWERTSEEQEHQSPRKSLRRVWAQEALGGFPTGL